MIAFNLRSHDGYHWNFKSVVPVYNMQISSVGYPHGGREGNGHPSSENMSLKGDCQLAAVQISCFLPPPESPSSFWIRY